MPDYIEAGRNLTAAEFSHPSLPGAVGQLKDQLDAVVAGTIQTNIYGVGERTFGVDEALLESSAKLQILSATAAALAVTMPDATGAAMILGQPWMIMNPTAGANNYAIKDFSAGVLLASLAPGQQAILRLSDDAAAAGVWQVESVLPLAGGAMTGPINYANEDGITAGAVQTQVGATALTKEINTVTVVATDGDGVKLPAAAAGGRVTVRNSDASEYLQVWPATGDAIDGGAVDAVDADPIGPGAWRTYVAADGTTWKREAQKAEFYVGSFTRDLTTAAGSQTVTGPTFKPTAIIMLAATGAAGEGSIGFSNGVLDAFLRDNYGITANTWNASTSRSVSIITSGSIYSQGYVTALLPRGWTFTWEKAGAPTGTATIAYLALRS